MSIINKQWHWKIHKGKVLFLYSRSLSAFQDVERIEQDLERSQRSQVKGWEPWSSGYGRRLMFQMVMGSNPGTIYLMEIFSHLFVVKIVMFV